MSDYLCRLSIREQMMMLMLMLMSVVTSKCQKDEAKDGRGEREGVTVMVMDDRK